LRVFAQALCSYLIGRDVAANGDLRFFWMSAGEPGRARACVIACAIAQCTTLHLRQTAENHDVIAELFERLHRRHELEISAFGGWRPFIHDDAVRHINESESHW